MKRNIQKHYLIFFFQEITDLLTNKKNVKVRNNMDNEIVIDNLTEESIISYDQVMNVIETGKSKCCLLFSARKYTIDDLQSSLAKHFNERLPHLQTINKEFVTKNKQF